MGLADFVHPMMFLLCTCIGFLLLDPHVEHTLCGWQDAFERLVSLLSESFLLPLTVLCRLPRMKMLS